MSDIDTVAAYRDLREGVTSLAAGLDAEAVQTKVPGCPAWRVHDVVAHLAGVCADIVEGRLDGVGSDPWTAAQVEARRDRTMEDLLEEWSTAGRQVEALFPPDAAGQLCFDAAAHEADIRGALGQPGGRDRDALAAGFSWAIGAFGASLAERGLPALRMVADGDELVAGEGEPGATVRATRFDLFRSLTGRRSAAQITALDWDGDPDRYLPAFVWGPFTTPAADVAE